MISTVQVGRIVLKKNTLWLERLAQEQIEGSTDIRLKAVRIGTKMKVFFSFSELTTESLICEYEEYLFQSELPIEIPKSSKIEKPLYLFVRRTKIFEEQTELLPESSQNSKKESLQGLNEMLERNFVVVRISTFLDFPSFFKFININRYMNKMYNRSAGFWRMMFNTRYKKLLFSDENGEIEWKGVYVNKYLSSIQNKKKSLMAE